MLVRADSDGVIAVAVKGVALSAVTKSLDTLTIAIRKTIDMRLNTIKEAMKVNANDTPVSSDKKISEINN